MLHLTTAANGAESFYESGPDTQRTEGAQACSLVITPRMEGVQANPNPNPNPIPNPHPRKPNERSSRDEHKSACRLTLTLTLTMLV